MLFTPQRSLCSFHTSHRFPNKWPCQHAPDGSKARLDGGAGQVCSRSFSGSLSPFSIFETDLRNTKETALSGWKLIVTVAISSLTNEERGRNSIVNIGKRDLWEESPTWIKCPTNLDMRASWVLLLGSVAQAEKSIFSPFPCLHLLSLQCLCPVFLTFVFTQSSSPQIYRWYCKHSSSCR